MIAGGRVLLHVADVDASVRFYVERLGVKLVAQRPGVDAVLDFGGSFELALEQGPTPRSAERASVIELVVRDDFEGTVVTYENRSLDLHRGRTARGDYAELRDPDGHRLRLVAG